MFQRIEVNTIKAYQSYYALFWIIRKWCNSAWRRPTCVVFV